MIVPEYETITFKDNYNNRCHDASGQDFLF